MRNKSTNNGKITMDNFKVGDRVRFAYHDKVREGVVENVWVSQKGIPCIKLHNPEFAVGALTTRDATEYRTFHVFKMQDVEVL